MLDTNREIIAFGLIAIAIITLVPWGGCLLVRNKKEKLRRRGIKRHGH